MIKVANKKNIILLIIMVGLLIAAIVVYINPYKGTISRGEMEGSLPYDQQLTKSQAQSELEYMVKLIEDRHLSAKDALPINVETQYNEEIANLHANPTVLELWTAGSRILKQLEDAHSSIYYYGAEGSHINIEWKYRDNVLICNNGEHAGQRIESINGINIEDLYKRFLAQFSYENIYYAEYNFPNYLKRKHTLNWLGVASEDSIKITFSNNGVYQSEDYDFQEISSPKVKQDFVRYSIDKEKKVGTLTLDSCQFNDYYKETVKNFFTEVKEQDIKVIAVDLRKNGGGNSNVADEFVRYLPVDNYMNFGSKVRFKSWISIHDVSLSKNNKYDNLVFDGDVYVFTSNSTFSSATWFAVLLHDNDLAKIIGEPSGNKPSAYGDVLSFQMPYSKLSFTLTYKEFSRPDVAKDDEKALLPDYPIEQENALDELYRII